MYLSPHAAKAVQAAQARRRSRWPGLGRTQTKLILSHPIAGGYKHRAHLATYVRHTLPDLQWNGQRRWWEIALNTANLEQIIAAFTQVDQVQLRLSEGVKDLLA